MSKEDARLATIKSEVTSGQVHPDIVYNVATLLGLPHLDTQGIRDGERAIKTKHADNGHGRSTISKLQARQHKAKALPPTTGLKFATELATLGSRTLSQAQIGPTRQSASNVLTDRSHNASDPPPRRPAKDTNRIEIREDVSNIAARMSHVADCVHLALTYLRINHTQQNRNRLVEASLAFCRRLCDHQLSTVVWKELSVSKQMLDGSYNRSMPKSMAEKFEIDKLLRFGNIDITDLDTLRLALVHQSLVLKYLLVQKSLDSVIALSDYLHAAPIPPHALVLQQLAHSKDVDKTALQLDALARSIKSLCVLLSGADTQLNRAPLALLRLSSYSLQLQMRWWIMAKHEIDVGRSSSTQFLKIMRQYVSEVKVDECRSYEAVASAYAIVFEDVQQPVQPGSDVLIEMHRFAKATGDTVATQSWKQKMDSSAQLLGDDHCLRMLRITRDLVDSGTGPYSDQTLEIISQGLRSDLDGNEESYAVMLAELVKVLRNSAGHTSKPASSSFLALAQASVSLVTKIHRKSPAVDGKVHKSVVLAVVRSCTREQLMATINHDCLAIAADLATLEKITIAIRSSSLKAAFASSAETMLLGEILDIMVVKHLTAANTTDEQLSFIDTLDLPASKGILLERQLQALLKHGGRSKVRNTAQMLASEILLRLKGIYTPVDFSVRRALVSIQCAVAFDKGIVKESDALGWSVSPAEAACFEDDQEDRSKFADDIKACLQICAVLKAHEKRPEHVEVALEPWQSILASSHDQQELMSSLYDSAIDCSLLDSIIALCDAQHWQYELVMATSLLYRLHEMLGSAKNLRISALVSWYDASTACSCLAQSGKIIDRLKATIDDGPAQAIDNMRSALAIASHCLELGDLNGSHAVLHGASQYQSSVSKHDRRDMAKLCSKAWWLQSRISMQQGDLQSAMHCARTAIALVNSLWKQLELECNDTTCIGKSRSEDGMDEVVQKVSKLQLKSNSDTPQATTSYGPAFWNLAPLAINILLHLTSLYSYAGLLIEARHHAVRAVEIADSIPGSSWIPRARANLANLLTTAGLVEEAELCLTKADSPAGNRQCLAHVELLMARATLHNKLGERLEALQSIDEASDIVRVYSKKHGSISVTSSTSDTRPGGEARGKGSKVRTRTRAIPPSTKLDASTRTIVAASDYDKMLQDLQCLRATIQGDYTNIDMSKLGATNSRFRHQCLMSELHTRCQMDVFYNALDESSLFYPSLTTKATTTSAERSSRKRPGRGHPKGGPTRTSACSGALSDVLSQAIACLSEPSLASKTTELHKNARLLARSTIYALASSLGSDIEVASRRTAEAVSDPNIVAKQRERSSILANTNDTRGTTDILWPSTVTTLSKRHVERIAIEDDLPEFWSVVSVTLSDDMTELIVVRRRRSREPTVVRLPFARETDDVDTETFDFEIGRAQLKDIIEKSNSICHAGNDPSKQMASATWWRKREELDRELHNLVINIEESWFGGFRGIFCPSPQTEKAIQSFRKQFLVILAKHVPAFDGQSYNVFDATLELFLDLCYGQGEDLNIDNAVLDLCYGVIDALRFNGLQLAYDELDLDSITVDIVDALQSRHQEPIRQDSHLILILDKKLQNFPWESLPFLSNTSTSRMTDALSLQTILRNMQSPNARPYTLSPTSGTIVLDPASNMERTKQTMMPVVESLQGQSTSWRVLTGQIPAESDFQQALESSDVFLYFGHGAGSQYIRPRVVKRLQACSRVVWLMGCSSGEVTEYDELEPTSVPAAYMLAAAGNSAQSCLAVVANLWDVTDKDIDHFSLAVGEHWGLWSIPEDGKATKKARRARTDALKTPPGSPTTPAVPKTMRKVDEIRKGVAASRRDGRPCSLPEAVSRSRDACYLRYLNGAAPVVYGVPVYLDTSRQ